MAAINISVQRSNCFV